MAAEFRQITGARDFTVTRYTGEGALDAGFGADHDSEGNRDGYVTVDFGSGSDRPNAVSVRPDGKVSVAGTGNVGSNLDLALARSNADGTLDTSFNAGGKVNSNFGSVMAQGWNVTLRSDEKVVAAGYGNNRSNTEFALARCHADMLLSTGGTLNVLTASGSASCAYRVLALTPDLCSRYHDYQATAPHTTAYARLMPTANDSAPVLWVGRSDLGCRTPVDRGSASPPIPLNVLKAKTLTPTVPLNQSKDQPTPKIPGASTKGPRSRG